MYILIPFSGDLGFGRGEWEMLKETILVLSVPLLSFQLFFLFCLFTLTMVTISNSTWLWWYNFPLLFYTQPLYTSCYTHFLCYVIFYLHLASTSDFLSPVLTSPIPTCVPPSPSSFCTCNVYIICCILSFPFHCISYRHDWLLSCKNASKTPKRLLLLPSKARASGMKTIRCLSKYLPNYILSLIGHEVRYV